MILLGIDDLSPKIFTLSITQSLPLYMAKWYVPIILFTFLVMHSVSIWLYCWGCTSDKLIDIVCVCEFVCVCIFVSCKFLWYHCVVLNAMFLFCLSHCGVTLCLFDRVYVPPSGVSISSFCHCFYLNESLLLSPFYLVYLCLDVCVYLWLSLCWFLSMFHISVCLGLLLLWPRYVLLLCVTDQSLLLMLLLLLTPGWHFRPAASKELGLPWPAGTLNPSTASTVQLNCSYSTALNINTA